MRPRMVVSSANLKMMLEVFEYKYTGVTPGISFPEFTLVGLLDGEEFVYYDSNIRRMIPKTEWMTKAEDDDPDYWNRNTQWAQASQEDFSLVTVMQLYKHTEGETEFNYYMVV
ncbi:hypothetical protein NFI96_006757 [Prochilodus magdalenae]|nr:hypothetical protein NFI96_006757 [Prochilodus magdalenae]